MKSGLLIIISGPSGVGKGTIIKSLLDKGMPLVTAVSATTREKRVGEVDKKDYYFMSNEDFDQSIEDNAFIEWCWVHQNRYGTLKKEVLQRLNSGENVVLEIDVQGAKKVMTQFTDYLSVLIVPPTLNVLKERLLMRQTEPDDVIALRLKKAEEELQEKDQYHYIVVNQALEKSVREVETIINSRIPKKTSRNLY